MAERDDHILTDLMQGLHQANRHLGVLADRMAKMDTRLARIEERRDAEAIPDRLNQHAKRIGSLERWRTTILGIALGVGFVFALILRFLHV